MPATVSHALSMTTPDDPAYENKPSNWNATHALTLSATGSEIVGAFSNANGLSFGLSAGAVTASHNALTTAAASNHSHGNPQLNLTNLTGTTASNSAGFTLSLSAAGGGADGVNILAAGTQTANTTGTVLFQNSNGITFGMSNSSVITASHNALTTAMASNRGSDFVQATAAFAGTSASGTIASGGISVSIGPYITTAMLSNAATISNIRVSAGTTSNLLSALTFADGNGISFGINASTLTGSHNGLTSQSNQNVTAGNGGFAFQTLSFSNVNGISFGTSAGSAITASHNALTTAAASDHSHGNPTLALTNLTGTTASASNGFTLSLSAAAPGGAAITQSIGMSTQTAGGATAGTTGYATGDDVLYHFVPGSNITMSQSVNGASATLSIYGPAGGNTLSQYDPYGVLSGNATNSSLGQNTLYFQPFDVVEAVSGSRLNVFIRLSGATSTGTASTVGAVLAMGYGLYTLGSGASTERLTRVTSYSMNVISQTVTNGSSYGVTHYIGLSNATSHSTSTFSAQSSSGWTSYVINSLYGQRAVAFPLNSTLTPGRYWLAIANSATTSNLNNLNFSVSVMQTSIGVIGDVRPFGTSSAATNASVYRALQGWGTYSATSAGFPDSIALSTDAIRAPVAQTLVHFNVSGFAYGTNRL